jgi:predicted amidohydrolase YtcJ
MRTRSAGVADLLIVHGRVFRGFKTGQAPPLGSADGPRPEGAPTAIAVVGERIAWVGDSSEALRAWRGPRTELLDARGGLVSAGFDDAHIHLLDGARQMDDIDLTRAATPQEIGAAIRAGAAERSAKPWVVGRGWLYGSFPAGLPTRQQLDHLVPDRPALMGAYDGHTTWVNSRALATAGIRQGTPDPADGVIQRDLASGEPTGMLFEAAGLLVERCLPVLNADEDLAVLRTAIAAAHRNGITAVQEAWTPPGDLLVWRRLAERDVPRLRARLALPMKPEGDLAAWHEQLADYGALAFPLRGGRWLSAGILKGFVDGAIESGTAAMLAPYEGDTSRGLPNWSSEQLAEFVSAADAAGWQVELHAIGDRGVRMALDAFEQAAANARWSGNPRGSRQAPNSLRRRHRVEHIETIDPADIPRFGRLGVIASMQPYHGEPSTNQATAWSSKIGADRVSRAWAVGSIDRAGGTIAFGSDWPVVSFNPFLGLHVAVNRQTPDGHPPGGWVPAEAVPLPTALSAYTLGSALAAFTERRRGTIQVGLQADLAVLDRDLLSEDRSAIAGTAVSATVIGGRVVHRTTG